MLDTLIRVSKLDETLKTKMYLTRFEILGRTTLIERRERGDAIQYFIITKNLDKVSFNNPKQAISLILFIPALR